MTKEVVGKAAPSKILDIPIPQWVRDILGDGNVSVIESGIFSKAEYRILLDFVGNRGFDLEEELEDCSLEANPAKTTKIYEREFNGSLSTLFLNGTYQPSDVRSQKLMPKFVFGLGRARLLFNNEDILVEHAMNKPAGDRKAEAYECIRFFGKSAQILRDLAADVLQWDACRKQPKSEVGKYALWMMEVDSEEGELRLGSRGLRTARPLKNLILSKGIRDELERDAREFFTSDAKEWYSQHGIPYRRTWLLHGPQGCGKTTTIGSIAAELSLNLCYLDIDRQADANPLEPAFRNIPRPAIVAIEDVERIIPNNLSGETGTYSNVLQGIAAVEDILVILTTSHLESIDPLHLKSNRIDRQFELKSPTQEDVEELFRTYYPASSKETAKSFTVRVFDRPEKDARTMATLQEHFIYTRKLTAEECVDALPEYYKKYYREGSREDRLGFYL